jgi:putative ABC transport system permease protein
VRTFLLEVTEGVRIALRAIWVNKTRSVLTTLGIIIGIVSVTSMATVINGLENAFDESLSDLGADVLYVEKWPWAKSDWWNYVYRPPIREELAQTIRERSDHAQAVAVSEDTDLTVQRGNQNMPEVETRGVTPSYGRVQGIKLASGRFFNDIDERSGRSVCVIGAELVKGLFPIAEPLGKEIRVGQHPCRVVGVLEKKGRGLGGENRDKRVLMPFSTFKRQFGISDWSGVEISVKVRSPEQMKAAEGELTGIIRTARQVDAMEDDNFAINQQDTIRERMAPVKKAIYGVGIFLTALALVVGGIGVMNIMFVSVRERTSEIGLRKAVGAKRRTIMLQFMIEAVVVCLLGGAIGVGITFGVSALINALGVPASLPFGTVVLAFGICVAVGLLFGLGPAWSAAKSEPIEALRYE